MAEDKPDTNNDGDIVLYQGKLGGPLTEEEKEDIDRRIDRCVKAPGSVPNSVRGW